MNSPGMFLDPIRQMYSTSKIDNLTPPKFKQPTSIAKSEQYFQSRNNYRAKNPTAYVPKTVQNRVMPKQTSTERGFEGIGSAASAAGAASFVFPALAPVAAGLGVGYGIYKLGHTFDLW